LTLRTRDSYHRRVQLSLRPQPRRDRRVVAWLILALSAGCSSAASSPEKSGITPAYDAATGRLTSLAYDSNHNGKPDTWTDMDGSRAVQTRIDRNEDGKIERWEYYDSQSKLVKVGFSRQDTGKPDAWAFAGADGKTRRIEISSTADAKRIDRTEHYQSGALVSAEEDTNHDGLVDKWETYADGQIKTAAFDENDDGKADRRLTYAAGSLIAIESDPDAAGAFTRTVAVKPD
jgi:hypothetical protein